MTDFPASHEDLLTDPLTAVLTTIDVHGRPQSTAVWYAFEDGTLKLSITTDRQKYRNLTRNPACTVIIIDPTNTIRTLEVRADAELTPDPDYTEVTRLATRYGWGQDDARRIGGERWTVTLRPHRVIVNPRPQP